MFRHEFIGDTLLFAVDGCPFSRIVEFYLSAVYQLYVIVGLLKQMLVDLNHRYFCFWKVSGNHLLRLYRKIVTVKNLTIFEYQCIDTVWCKYEGLNS